MVEILIETSAEIGYLAILQGSKVIKEQIIAPPKRQSQELLPLLHDLVPVHAIQEIAIGMGPGAFTGTRIGAICAKTLAFACDLPLIPFCSLEGSGPENAIVVTDAKAGYLYLFDGEKTHLITPDELPKDRPLFSPDLLLSQKHKMTYHPFSVAKIASTLPQRQRITWNELELQYLRKL